jgi:ribosomal protein S18
MEQRGMESRESRETGESKETSEARKLDDATLSPQEVVERSGDFKQAEAIQAGVSAAVETAQAAATGEKAPEAVRSADKAAGEKAVAKFSPEQKAAFEKFNHEDRAALTRLIGQSKRINPAKLKGTSGGIIY